MKTVAIGVLVHDSDTFQYLIFEKGELIDQFDSKPDYFGPVSDEQKKEWRGDFDKLLPYATKGTAISDFKHAATKEYVFEEERVGEFSKLLGIDPSRAKTGFKYLQETQHSFKLVHAKGYSQDQALLAEAVSRGDVAEVQALLQEGASPNQKDKFGIPLLVVAGRLGKFEMVRALVVHSADVFAEGQGGGDALWIASAEGHDQVVEHLIEKGKDDSKFVASLRTAFGAAVMAGHAKVIRHLIGGGADVNANTPLGQTPLMLASMRGQEFIWEARMKQPFPVRDGHRKTDWKEVVTILLEAGAQIPFPTKDGPIDVKTLSANQGTNLRMRYWRLARKSNCLRECTDTQCHCSYAESVSKSDLKLEKAGDFHAGDSGDAPDEVFHLVGEFFVDAARGFIHCRANQVLEHFLVFVGKNIRLDAQIHQLFLAVHFHSDHTAAGRSFHGHGVHLPLQVLHLLPGLR
ncbi:MAG TPA: ankyrin repeat domain-containing protein [Candidatus Acidoferrum sp.]|nr:ankyrin repeat domain-containing protein [Candidatus Acidoferrum sp.]